MVLLINEQGRPIDHPCLYKLQIQPLGWLSRAHSADSMAVVSWNRVIDPESFKGTITEVYCMARLITDLISPIIAYTANAYLLIIY